MAFSLWLTNENKIARRFCETRLRRSFDSSALQESSDRSFYSALTVKNNQTALENCMERDYGAPVRKAEFLCCFFQHHLNPK